MAFKEKSFKAHYKEKIDYIIIEILCKVGECTYSKLKRKVDEVLNKNLSDSTYDLHIKKMVDGGVLNKKKLRGKRTAMAVYSLTEEYKSTCDKMESIDREAYLSNLDRLD